jgi:DHA2 family multidrug resistance protein
MAKIAPATGIYNLMRQLGGSVGIALSATLVARYSAESRAAIAEHVSMYNPITAARIQQVTQMLVSRGVALGTAQVQAAASVMGEVQRQASMMAFEHIFRIFGIAFLLAIPLILTLQWEKGKTRGGSDAH